MEKIIRLIRLIFRISIVKSMFYSARFKGIIVVGKRCKINIRKDGRILFNNKKSSLYIGVYFSLYSGTTLDIFENGVLKVGKSVGIHRGTKVVVQKNAEMHVGDRTFLNENSRVQCLKKITIGSDCSISWDCTIIDSDLHGIYNENILINPNSEVVIGDKVLICSNSTITKGAFIEGNNVIGANSLVGKKRVEKGYIYSGNPLKQIKKIQSWGNL